MCEWVRYGIFVSQIDNPFIVWFGHWFTWSNAFKCNHTTAYVGKLLFFAFLGFGFVLLCPQHKNENSTANGWNYAIMSISCSMHVFIGICVYLRNGGGVWVRVRVRIESSRCDVLAGGNDKAILDFRQASVNRINYWSELESLPLAWRENEKEIWYVLFSALCSLSICACAYMCRRKSYIYIEIFRAVIRTTLICETSARSHSQ